ncbi:antifungal protein ginkbilobin-like protein [Henckelia pumila]|uniref:antifungal protein ginkbilobin-like protein n=1 Tax=Henckelia pumila TaxID=405737 RepID=UPI003C6E8CC9
MRNQTNSFTTIITLIIGLLAISFSAVKSHPNTTVQTIICNAYTYAKIDPFGKSVAYVLADTMNVTPSIKGYDYYTVSPYPTAIAYGHATCNVKLPRSQCARCLVAARGTVSSSCANRIGGQVTMVDCSMRYENYEFA